MPATLPNFEYDIFISYRHNDNRSGWVTEFVKALQEELAATIKESVSVYFDSNPHDGLLETHNIDKSLEGKLKCLIFIPIISQTYCDQKSFAWQHEFCAFNKLAKEDHFGMDIKLSNGNVSSRILPIKIHDLDAEDKTTIENEINGVLRAIEFIFNSAGVSRPLTPTDKRDENLNHLFYRDQINKVARAIKEVIAGLQHSKDLPKEDTNKKKAITKPGIKKISLAAVIIILLSITGFGIYYFGGLGNKIAPTIDRSIAVLPFVNMSKDPDQEYFSDGMTDEVLNHLFKLGDLKVISRTSSMKFKGAKLTAKEIASQLGVANILEGSIQRAGNRIKITVQLIDANSDDHLWSETYQREFIDIFSIQAEIAAAVAQELRIKLSPESRGGLTPVPTKSKLAYEFYLRGKDYESKAEPGNAIRMYSRAIQEDSLFALAYANRAHAYLFRFWLRNIGWEEYKELARSDIEILKRINPELPELKLVLAYWHYYCFMEYDKALELLKALQVQIPNDPGLHQILAPIFRRQGKWTEAILEFEKTISLDPLNAGTIEELCNAYGTLHRYEDQLTTARKGIFLIPEYKGFKWQILVAEINLHHDFSAAMKASGFTVEEIGFYKDYYNKDFSSFRNRLGKQGVRLFSDPSDYKPITLNYATVYFLEGNRPMAKVYADSSISFLMGKLPEMIDDHRIYSSLGISYAISGQEGLAIQYGEKAMKLLPVSLDAWYGTFPEQSMIDIYIFLGKYDIALEKIDRLLSIPSDLGIGLLLIDPKYEPVRNLPRFRKLVEKYKGKL